MKITKRMKKILLFLLHPENKSKWVAENFPWWKHDDYPYWMIMTFCERKDSSNFTHVERVSYHRTFRILEKHGLIESGWRLTERGRKMAEKIEKEIRNLLRDYEYLVS